MSFEYNGTKISARTPTIGDSDAIGDLMVKLPEDQRTLRMHRFIEFVVVANLSGSDLRDFPILGADSTAEAIEAAYRDWWRALPRKFLINWQDELIAAEGNPKA